MKLSSILASLVFASTLGLTTITSAETIRVGSTPTGIPFTFLNTKTNQIEGAMVDMAHAVGKEAGFTAQIEAMPFSALIGSLTSNRIEMISAAMFITDARKEVVDFSQPIYQYGEGLMINKNAPKRDYTSLQDLKGLTVGVQVGTAFVEPLQKIDGIKEVRLYDGSADMIRDLNVGRIQAGILDYPIAAYILSQGNHPNVMLDKAYKPTVVGSIGMATNKGNTELMARINAALDKLKADGTVDQILKKWGL